MTDKAVLKWSVIANQSFEFTVTSESELLPVEKWGLYEVHHDSGIGCVNALFRDDDLALKPVFNSSKVTCSKAFIASLTELEVKQLGLPSPSQILLRISTKWRVPTRQGTHLPHDSFWVNSWKNRATSTMQVFSSMITSPPEPMIAPTSCTDS